MNVVTIIGVVAAYALVFMAAICLFAEKELHPFRRLRRKFAKLPFFAKLLVLVFGVTLFVHGSLKSPMNFPPRSAPIVQQITDDDVSRGFMLASISTNSQFSIPNSQFSTPVTTNLKWRLRGAHEDWFAAASETNAPWAFQFGTNLAESVAVHSCGWAEFGIENGKWRIENGELGVGKSIGYELWPFKAPLGIVPEANWGMIAGNGNSQFPILNSQFWHAATPSNTLLLTWQNALLERDTNMPVSVQAELWPDGRFAYRYDLTCAKDKVQSGELDYDSLTNIIIGAHLKDAPLQLTLADLLDNPQFSLLCQGYGGQAILNSQFTLSFHPVSAEDLADPDRDGDGLSTADEIFVHGTDPGNPDTDFDGLSDYEELFVYFTDPLNPHTLSPIYSDGLAVRLGPVDPFELPILPFVVPEVSTNTVLEHIFYSGTTNGAFAIPQSTERTAVLSVTVSGTGHGDLIVGGKVVPLVGAPPMRGGGQPSYTLHASVAKGQTHQLWLRGDGGLSVTLDSGDFAFGVLPAWDLHRATGWINFPNAKATEPCIHDFRARSRMVTLPAGEGAEQLQCTWTGGSGVSVENLPPRSALLTGSFSPRSTSSATYELSHPLHLFGEAVHAQTVRFCPRLEESDPGGGDDGGGSWYDDDPGEPPDDLGGAYDTTPDSTEDDDEEMDELCPEHLVPYDQCAHLHQAEYEAAALLPALGVLKIRDPLRYEPIQLFAPEGARNCCPCPEHATNFVAAAYVSPRMSLVDMDGMPFAQSAEDCTVRLAGVHPSTMPEDALLSFVTNNGIWRTYRKTVLGVDIKSGSLNLDMLEGMNPVFGLPVPLSTNLQSAATLDFVTKVGLGGGNIHLEFANATGAFALWRYDGRCNSWIKLLDTESSPTRDYSLQRWRKLMVRSGSNSESVPIRITSSAPGHVDVLFRYWGEFGGKLVKDEAARRVTSVPPPLLADTDWDGALGPGDVADSLAGRPFRFWTNEDVHKGDYVGQISDLAPNASDLVVNGRLDLVNLFPVRLDLKPFIDAWGSAATFRLRASVDGLHFCGVDAPPSVAWNYQTNDVYTTTSDPMSAANLMSVTESGVEINPTDHLGNDNTPGVLAFEAAQEIWPSVSPELIVEVGGKTVFAYRLPLALDRVRNMYSWIGARHLSGERDYRNTSYHFMWEGENVKSCIFFHGFNVTGEGAQEWGDAVFKRLWLSGAKVEFYNVDWRGDIGSDANYHQNASNAFVVASQLAPMIAAIPGEKVVMAHSLGNMIVSSMIQDYGLQVSKYIMCNSAVSSEAYYPTNDESIRVPQLVHPQWEEYPTNSWASNWHKLFANDLSDDRRKLGWPGRFANVVPYVVNFYSTGDEVLELLEDNDINILTGVTSSYVQYSWHHQELWKGRGVANIAGGTTWSGWNIEENWLGVNKISVSEAQQMSPEDFKTNTVFYCYPSSMNSTDISLLVRAAHLTQGIPALARPTGTTNLMHVVIRENECDLNLDESALSEENDPPSIQGLERPNGWPIRWRWGDRWLHSDMKDMSYFYNFKFYEKLVEKGNLQ